jgi:hypothetical protein
MLTSKTALFLAKLYIWQEKYFCRRKSEQGINREITGRYQGIKLPDQGIVAGRFSGECGEMDCGPPSPLEVGIVRRRKPSCRSPGTGAHFLLE